MKALMNIKVGVLSFAALLLALFLVLVAHAENGEKPLPGGLIGIDGKTSSVSMLSAKVNFRITKNDGNIFGKDVSEYSHVKADFVMHNSNKTKAETDQVYVPLHFDGDAGQLQEKGQAKNLKVVVNQKSPVVDYKTYSWPSDASRKTLAGAFSVEFAANSDTYITVEYDLRAVKEPDSQDITWSYLMETGAGWAGKIGSGQVVYDLPIDVSNDLVFTSVSSPFKIQDGNLVWDFANLEPSAVSNAQVTYDPANVLAWDQRPPYIKDIRVSSYVHGGVYVSGDFRSGGQLAGSKQNANPINLIDNSNLRRGWLAEQKTNDINQWIEFEFTSPYSFTGLQIRSGYLESEWSSAVNQEQDHYDTFKRPRTIVITYSDGTVQSAELKDQSDQMQTINISESKSISSLRLAFSDAYSGTGGGDSYFGMGRVNFIGAKKIDVQAATGANDGGMFNAATLMLIVIMLLIVGVVVGGLVFIVARLRQGSKKAHLTMNNTSTHPPSGLPTPKNNESPPPPANQASPSNSDPNKEEGGWQLYQ